MRDEIEAFAQPQSDGERENLILVLAERNSVVNSFKIILFHTINNIKTNWQMFLSEMVWANDFRLHPQRISVDDSSLLCKHLHAW